MKKNNYTAPRTLVMMIDTEMPIAVSPQTEPPVTLVVDDDENKTIEGSENGGFAKVHFNVWEDD